MTLQTSNPIVVKPPAISTRRPRLMPRRRTRVTRGDRPGIRFWPESERPREKLLTRGPQALSDGELIALLVGSGTKGRSAVDIARSLIEEFGSLRELLTADQQRMEKRQGIGPARYAMLQAALEISRRVMLEPLRETPTLATPEATRRFLLAQLRDRHYEVFCCIFLDNRHRMLGFEEIFRGTIDGANVYPGKSSARLSSTMPLQSWSRITTRPARYSPARRTRASPGACGKPYPSSK